MAGVIDDALRRRLLAMSADEDRVHTELSRSGEIYGAHHPRLAEVDARNARELAAIIDRVGWAGPSRAATLGRVGRVVDAARLD